MEEVLRVEFKLLEEGVCFLKEMFRKREGYRGKGHEVIFKGKAIRISEKKPMIFVP